MINLERIEQRYNPDHDVPDGVQVSWVDYELLQAIKEQDSRIAKLEAALADMKFAVRKI